MRLFTYENLRLFVMASLFGMIVGWYIVSIAQGVGMLINWIKGKHKKRLVKKEEQR